MHAAQPVARADLEVADGSAHGEAPQNPGAASYDEIGVDPGGGHLAQRPERGALALRPCLLSAACRGPRRRGVMSVSHEHLADPLER